VSWILVLNRSSHRLRCIPATRLGCVESFNSANSHLACIHDIRACISQLVMLQRESRKMAALILLLLASPAWTQEPQWPYNLPEGMKYYPEDEVLVKRGLDSLKRLETQRPVGVKKMSPDPNEMFFLDYWEFEDGHHVYQRSVDIPDTNQSYAQPLFAPIRPVLREEFKARRGLDFFGHNSLVKRFQCPDGYGSCQAINQPNLCCATGATCFTSSGGAVGCCPMGQVCGTGTNIGNCDTAAGYNGCPGSPNGGCCIPGFTCQGLGCKSTLTVSHMMLMFQV
jgi:hypothetical protein